VALDVPSARKVTNRRARRVNRGDDDAERPVIGFLADCLLLAGSTCSGTNQEADDRV
jgi:hypothetical protein